MRPASSKQLSELLLHWGDGDRQALEAILPPFHGELRPHAHNHFRQQPPNPTLQPTSLVHEAYLRLSQEKSLEVENRTHFLGIAAQLMRWILVDYERKRRAAKRGAGVTRLTLDPNVAGPHPQNQEVDLLALDEALSRPAKLDSTVKRSWAFARASLLREMGRGEARA